MAHRGVRLNKAARRRKMRKIWLIAAAVTGFGAIAIAAEQPPSQSNKPSEPPASGTSSSDLGRSGGVITPPADVDPQMKQTPPPSGARMPVIPPPGTPGGDPSIKPK
jgi:hypothetical protein